MCRSSRGKTICHHHGYDLVLFLGNLHRKYPFLTLILDRLLDQNSVLLADEPATHVWTSPPVHTHGPILHRPPRDRPGILHSMGVGIFYMTKPPHAGW